MSGSARVAEPAGTDLVRVCAWCGDEIDPASDADVRPCEKRSHGMCERCARKLIRDAALEEGSATSAAFPSPSAHVPRRSEVEPR
jgi:hypothetical protein